MLQILRYLTFEINHECPLEKVHPKCPISHPERYKFGQREIEITDDTIYHFWLYCKSRGFRGVVLWHWLNEPTLSLDRIRPIMARMKRTDHFQAFQITTYRNDLDLSDFDMVKRSNYDLGVFHDERFQTSEGEGKTYADLPKDLKRGLCGRGLGWELLIDNWGNWCLCCNDFRCEEMIGNINCEDWDTLFEKWDAKRKTIQWNNEAEYNALPRMCRSCLDKNPSLHIRGGV